MSDTAARVAIIARRNEVARFTIVVDGIDMTGVAMAMQVRQERGNPHLLFALATVSTLSAEGLKLDSVTIVDGIPRSIIKGRINKTTMDDADKVPYAGEIGTDMVFAYAMQWTLNGDANTRVEGPFIVRDTAFGSDNAPASRPPSYGTTSAMGASTGALTFGDQVIHVTIGDAPTIGLLLAQAETAATTAVAAAALVQDTADYLELVPVDVVYGSAALDTANGAGDESYANITAPSGGILKQVRIRLAAAGTGALDVVNVATGAIFETFPVNAPGAGVLTLDNFGGYEFPDGCELFYRVISGALIRSAGSTGSIYYYSAADAADNQVTLSTFNSVGVALEYTIIPPLASREFPTLSARLASTESFLALTGSVETIYGSVTPNNSSGVAGSGYAADKTVIGGELVSVRIRFRAAGTGAIDVLQPNDAGGATLLRSFDVAAGGAGVVAFTDFDGYQVPSGCILGYRALSGAAIGVDNSGGVLFFYGNNDALDGQVALNSVAPTGIALEYTIRRLADAAGFGSLDERLSAIGGDFPTLELDGSWNGLFAYGQSLSTGIFSGQAISLTQPYANKTFGSGPRSSKPGNGHGAGNTSPGTTTVKALVEDNVTSPDGAPAGETICSGAANQLVTLTLQARGGLPADCVIFAAAAGHGGYKIAQLSRTAPWYAQLTDQVSEMVARAAQAGTSAKVAAVVWMQGENDAAEGTGTARSAYLEMLLQLAEDLNTDIKALTGQRDNVHLLAYQTCVGGAVLSQLNTIQLAQVDAARLHPRIHMVGPIYHLMGGSPDSIHMSPLGELYFGRYVGRALYQLAVEQREPDRITPRSATARGTALTIRFDVPTGPLVIDAFIAMATDAGFKVVDDMGTLALASVAVGGDGKSVTMTLSRALGANPRARYALDYLGAGLLLANGASGNLRDSTPDSFTGGGATFPLYHACPAFEQAVAVLEA